MFNTEKQTEEYLDDIVKRMYNLDKRILSIPGHTDLKDICKMMLTGLEAGYRRGCPVGPEEIYRSFSDLNLRASLKSDIRQ